MEIQKSYTEVVSVLEGVLLNIFRGLQGMRLPITLFAWFFEYLSACALAIKLLDYVTYIAPSFGALI